VFVVTPETTVPPALCCPPVTDAVLDEDHAAELAALLKALADPIRIRLVSILAAAPTGEVCACDLPDQLGRTQPTVSHHLSLLVTAGIVEREQRGKWAWFRLRPERLAAVCTALGADVLDCRPRTGR
jgi:ArsR family transcriptional regulator, arsenate/arsenite/antimonite-responsive transcriptional repressor